MYNGAMMRDDDLYFAIKVASSLENSDLFSVVTFVTRLACPSKCPGPLTTVRGA